MSDDHLGAGPSSPRAEPPNGSATKQRLDGGHERKHSISSSRSSASSSSSCSSSSSSSGQGSASRRNGDAPRRKTRAIEDHDDEMRGDAQPLPRRPPPQPQPQQQQQQAPLSASTQASGSSSQVQQVGSRQGTRSRSRTTRKASTSEASNAAAGAATTSSNPSSRSRPSNLERFNSEDHPLSAHRLAARGYHSFSCLGVPFHVPKRYTFVRELGIGAYGCVALARDEELDTNVAIKKVTRVFERDVLARRALREVAILRHMLKNQNCTALIDFDTTFIDFSEIYLVLSASEADLSQIIRSGQALSDAHLQYFAAQLLRGVRYMHAANIVHRDLKPGNLLVNADCALFICDFGLARAFAPPDAVTSKIKKVEFGPVSDANGHDGHQGAEAKRDGQDGEQIGNGEAASSPQPGLAPLQTSRLDFPGGPLTEYVSTRWYRAPEIMLGFRGGYGTEIDMWSVGCILAELASGKPLFDGKDYVDQIARIHSVLGPPDQSVIDRISSERARVYVESLPQQDPVPLSKILKGRASAGLVDLLENLLLWDPDKRYSAQDALKHPWLSAYHGIIEQWDRPEPFDKFDEVELINSLGEFKGALQRESDEVKGEYDALFGAGAGAGGDDDPTNDDGSAAAADDDGEEERAGDDTVTAAGSGGSRRGSLATATHNDEPGQDTSAAAATTASSTATAAATSWGSAGSGSSAGRTGGGAPSSPEAYLTDTTGGTGPSPNTSVSEPASARDNAGGLKAFPTAAGASEEGDTDAAAPTSTTGGHHRSRPRQTLPNMSGVAAATTTSTSSTIGGGGSGGGGEESAAIQHLLQQQQHVKPRYRRRAISNAPRAQDGTGLGFGTVAAGMGIIGEDGRLPNVAEVPATTANGAEAGSQHNDAGNAGGVSLDLAGVTEFSPDRDDAVLTPQRPSPDFRRYTTDLIARPRSELGAFGSPALEAGDNMAHTLRRSSGSRGSRSRLTAELTAIRSEAVARSRHPPLSCNNNNGSSSGGGGRRRGASVSSIGSSHSSHSHSHSHHYSAGTDAMSPAFAASGGGSGLGPLSMSTSISTPVTTTTTATSGLAGVAGLNLGESAVVTSPPPAIAGADNPLANALLARGEEEEELADSSELIAQRHPVE